MDDNTEPEVIVVVSMGRHQEALRKLTKLEEALQQVAATLRADNPPMLRVQWALEALDKIAIEIDEERL